MTVQGQSSEAATKFNPDGTARPFAGNTFVSFVTDGAFAAGLDEVHTLLTELPGARLFTPVPPETYHVTVLDGTLAEPGPDQRWPADIDPDLSIDGLTSLYAERLSRSNLQVPECLVFDVGGISDVSDPLIQLRVELSPVGHTMTDLSDLRARLSSLLGLPHDPSPAKYHVTLAYRVDTTDDPVGLQRLRTALATVLPTRVTFDEMVFVDFPTMVEYRRIAEL